MLLTIKYRLSSYSVFLSECPDKCSRRLVARWIRHIVTDCNLAHDGSPELEGGCPGDGERLHVPQRPCGLGDMRVVTMADPTGFAAESTSGAPIKDA